MNNLKKIFTLVVVALFISAVATSCKTKQKHCAAYSSISTPNLNAN